MTYDKLANYFDNNCEGRTVPCGCRYIELELFKLDILDYRP